MKVTRKILRTLIKEGHYNRDYAHYRILAEEKVTKEVQHPIPYQSVCTGIGFPEYLKGFEECYKMDYHSLYTTYWSLKPEYKENRPKYTYKVTYTVYDIELTEQGREEIERRYYMHLRLTERYARLLG